MKNKWLKERILAEGLALCMAVAMMATGCTGKVDSDANGQQAEQNQGEPGEDGQEKDGEDEREKPNLDTTVDVNVTVEEITKDTKLGVLFDSEEMGDFAEFLIYRSENYAEKLKEQSPADLNAGNASWNADAMVYGVNHVLDLIHEGVRVDYDIYTEDEKMVDEERKETKLFYFPGKEGNPFVMLCAGGGFTSCCSLVESFPVAAKLNELGYNVFVLSYRIEYPVCEDKWQAQINACQDVAAALEFINEHADAFKVSTKDYAIGGFSAGAMVVSQWGTDSNGYAKFGMDKPACVFLAYGGSAAKDEMSSKYPAAYVVYCKDDATVSPDGMAEMAARLKELGVPCEENAGAEGGHGFGLGLDTDVEGWVEEAVDFWQGQKG